jgi:hypothetical protein
VRWHGPHSYPTAQPWSEARRWTRGFR